MTVFAAHSNETGKGNVYPAADARAISVVDTNRGQLGMALVTGAEREKDALSVGITFAMHGGVPQGKHGNDFQTGASFSSAKAAAYGAVIFRWSERRVGNECVCSVRSWGARNH